MGPTQPDHDEQTDLDSIPASLLVAVQPWTRDSTFIHSSFLMSAIGVVIHLPPEITGEVRAYV